MRMISRNARLYTCVCAESSAAGTGVMSREQSGPTEEVRRAYMAWCVMLPDERSPARRTGRASGRVA
jgi:hypothetical protein